MPPGVRVWEPIVIGVGPAGGGELGFWDTAGGFGFWAGGGEGVALGFGISGGGGAEGVGFGIEVGGLFVVGILVGGLGAESGGFGEDGMDVGSTGGCVIGSVGGCGGRVGVVWIGVGSIDVGVTGVLSTGG